MPAYKVCLIFFRKIVLQKRCILLFTSFKFGWLHNNIQCMDFYLENFFSRSLYICICIYEYGISVRNIDMKKYKITTRSLHIVFWAVFGIRGRPRQSRLQKLVGFFFRRHRRPYQAKRNQNQRTESDALIILSTFLCSWASF